MYALSNLLRWLLGGLVCLLSVGVVSAIGAKQSITYIGTNNKGYLTITGINLKSEGTADVSYIAGSSVAQAGVAGSSLRFYIGGAIVHSRGISSAGFQSASGTVVNASYTLRTTGIYAGKYVCEFSVQVDSGTYPPGPNESRGYLIWGPPSQASFRLTGGENGSVYRITQGNTMMEDITVAPGDAFDYNVTTWDSREVFVYSYSQDRQKIDGFWYQRPGVVSTTAAGSSVPSSSGSSSPTVIDAPNGGAGNVSVVAGGDIGDAPVWTPVAATASLDGNLYREGVQKIVEAVKSSGNNGGGSSGGGDGVDHQGIAANNPTTAETQTAGVNAGNAARTAWGDAPSVPSSEPSASPPQFIIEIPFGPSGTQIDLNPFRSDRLGPVAQWVKKVAAWVIVLGFAMYALATAHQTVVDVTQAPQAKGNPVMAGTGAQATALAAAAAITVVVLTAVVALAAWKDVGLPGVTGGIFTTLSSNPFASAPSGIYWMLDQIFPVLTCVAAAVAKLSFRITAAGAYITASAAIRFIVP